jgi:hypothetical protein
MTRRTTLSSISLALVVVAAISWQLRATRDAPFAVPEQLTTAEPTAILGVDQFMRAVGDYQGPVLLEGAVSAVVADEQTLALIDVREFAECGITTCATLLLPVRWTGPMPSVRDIVRLRGEAKDSSGKLVFIASSLERVDLDGGIPQ